MPRPICCRRVAAPPACGLFKPAGVPCSTLDQLVLAVDELEALRLADLEGLYQEQAAERMGVSRQTFGRIIESARRKVARMLVEAKALRIEGGVIEMPGTRRFQCDQCRQEWPEPRGTGRPERCPSCGGTDIHRRSDDRGGQGCGCSRGGRRGRGRCSRSGRQPRTATAGGGQEQ